MLCIFFLISQSLYFIFLTYIEEECYSVVILAKSSALFHAKIFQTPCSIFFRSLRSEDSRFFTLQGWNVCNWEIQMDWESDV